MTDTSILPLPVTLKECQARGWSEVDIILVSGDAYIDHPSFGIAFIGRILEDHGYRVAILPQPRYDSEIDFCRFGRPRLFFGISGGNLDSIVANYSGNGKVRDFDAYSPGGNPWRSSEHAKHNRYRPDRAVLIYANLARKAYPGTTIVLGGIEASLRRFVHFDYKQNRLRGSHLTDSKADLLIYGMGERGVLDVAAYLSSNKGLETIQGSCTRMNDVTIEALQNNCRDHNRTIIELPSWSAIQKDISFFMEAEKMIDRHARGQSKAILIQKQQAAWVVQYPASPSLNPIEMDRFYALPFSRKPHPTTPDIPAFSMIRDSVTIVRGCSGNCSFCSISRHQGPSVTSRSVTSIIDELKRIAGDPSFTGTISDLGGPTANLFGTSCAIGSCKKHDCLYPEICKNLRINENSFIDLLQKSLAVGGVKHVYISSGLRMELLQKTPKLFKKLIEKHIPGNLKIAPEHTEEEVLALMHKEHHKHLVRFLETFHRYCRELDKKVQISPYIISAHPGCTMQHTRNMVQKLKKLGLTIRQFQDFTPTPGTLSTAMYVTGRDRDNGKKIMVAKNQNDRIAQRRLIENSFLKKNKSNKN